MAFLARILRIVVAAVVLVIVAGIVLHLLHASSSNGIVSAVHDAGAWLVSPFANIFHPKDPNVALAVNWGLAALFWRAGAAGRCAWMRRRRGVTTA